jgi:hypothetical protein
MMMTTVSRQVHPSRRAPVEPPEGLLAVEIGQLLALIINVVIQLIVLWVAVDAFERHALPEVLGLAAFNILLFIIACVVLRLGRDREA